MKFDLSFDVSVNGSTTTNHMFCYGTLERGTSAERKEGEKEREEKRQKTETTEREIREARPKRDD